MTQVQEQDAPLVRRGLLRIELAGGHLNVRWDGPYFTFEVSRRPSVGSSRHTRQIVRDMGRGRASGLPREEVIETVRGDRREEGEVDRAMRLLRRSGALRRCTRSEQHTLKALMCSELSEQQIARTCQELA